MRRALAGILRALSRLVDPAPHDIRFDDGQAHQLGWVNGRFYVDGKRQRQ